MSEPIEDCSPCAEYVRGRIEPCALCETPVHLFGSALGGHGVGHPMGEVYEHYNCPSEPAMQRIRDLAERLYKAEAVLVALYRIENVPDSVLDDRADYERTWERWKASRYDGYPATD